MSTVGEWLESREPAPPAALLERLHVVLGEDALRDVRDAADVCLGMGARLLEAVLANEDASRDCALDLLAADALVTYAFEAASGAPDSLATRASAAMTRIATLGVASAR